MPVQICVFTPENISIDNIGNIKVLKNVIQDTIPFCLSLLKRLLIFLILIRGTTAKITIIPSVDFGRSKSSGVAYNNVNITINIVVIEDIGL